MAAGLGAESLAARFKAGDGLVGYFGRWLLLEAASGDVEAEDNLATSRQTPLIRIVVGEKLNMEGLGTGCAGTPYEDRGALRGTPGSAYPQPEPNATELPSSAPGRPLRRRTNYLEPQRLRPLRHAPNTSPGCRSCASAPSPAAARRRELRTSPGCRPRRASRPRPRRLAPKRTATASFFNTAALPH